MKLLSRTSAYDALTTLREAREQWNAQHVEWTQRVDQLEAASADALLEDPAGLDRIATEISTARAKAEAAARASAAVEPKLREAELAVWAAAGREWTVEVKRRERALEAHQRVLADLLGRLQEHQQMPYEPVQGGTQESVLRQAVEQAKLQAQVSAMVAAGEDPSAMLRGLLASGYGATVHGLPLEDYFRPGMLPTTVAEAVLSAPAA